MFKKYHDLKGHKLFEDKIKDVLWNTKAEDCIDDSGIWYDESGDKYEMYINDINVSTYKEAVDILDTIAVTIAKFYTTKKVI